MAVSIDRYIGVTRPLNYGSIMTKRRTIYLIIIVWAVSILTSVVPLFGLTDRGQIVKGAAAAAELLQTCNINKNTFYTIFSSMVSFYIPVIILLILYSRVYQEAKKQGEKLENEKRRLYKIQYQIVSDSVREQSHPNGHNSTGRMNSQQSDEHHKEDADSLANHEHNADDEPIANGTATVDNGHPLETKHSDAKVQMNEGLLIEQQRIGQFNQMRREAFPDCLSRLRCRQEHLSSRSRKMSGRSERFSLDELSHLFIDHCS